MRHLQSTPDTVQRHKRIARGVRFDPDVLAKADQRAITQHTTFSDLVNAIVKRSLARAA